MEQAVLVQAQAPLDRALAHDDVVFFAAGEIHQGKREFGITHHAQIRLNAAGQKHARLRLTFGNDVEDAGLAAEKIEDLGGLFRGSQQIDIADDFAMPAQTAGRAATNHLRMRTERFEQGFGNGKSVADEMS